MSDSLPLFYIIFEKNKKLIHHQPHPRSQTCFGFEFYESLQVPDHWMEQVLNIRGTSGM
jgi:hypothetical protein